MTSATSGKACIADTEAFFRPIKVDLDNSPTPAALESSWRVDDENLRHGR
jgi:hypothetical protein